MFVNIICQDILAHVEVMVHVERKTNLLDFIALLYSLCSKFRCCPEDLVRDGKHFKIVPSSSRIIPKALEANRRE